MKNIARIRTVLLIICLVCFPLMGFWLGWILRAEYNRGMGFRYQGRFDQIEFMLRCYHADHGAFPPTKYQSSPGGPIHSWRVLLVTQLNTGYVDRLPKYDFSQEWDSQNNLQALGKATDLNYFKMMRDDEIAHYLTIGDDDKWPAEHTPLRSRLIIMGKDRFLLVEYPDSKVHWLEPRY